MSSPQTAPWSIVFDTTGQATLVTVSGPDVRGLLHAVTGALTCSNCSINSFYSQTDGGEARNTFVIQQAGIPVHPTNQATLKAAIEEKLAALLEATHTTDAAPPHSSLTAKAFEEPSPSPATAPAPAPPN